MTEQHKYNSQNCYCITP